MNTLPEFVGFPKIHRLSRECIITEKLDGTNAQIYITDDGQMLAGSRKRWISLDNDNYGFARWASEHRDELMGLGPGQHFGEWWGNGIQRGYGLPNGDKRWSLFNVVRWSVSIRPACCGLVPILYRGLFSTDECLKVLEMLRTTGSQAVPGYMRPEGIVCFHIAANVGFKKTIEKDDVPKGSVEEA